MLLEKLSNFRPQSQANQLCNQQIDSYEKSLQNLTLWALQTCISLLSQRETSFMNFGRGKKLPNVCLCFLVREASAMSTSGVLVGQRFHLGHYDECVAIKHAKLAGRYCLAYLKVSPSPAKYPAFYTEPLRTVEPPPDANAWDTLKPNSNWFRMNRTDLFMALCVPGACSRQDVEETLNATFADVTQEHGINVKIQMHDDLCTSSLDDEPMSFAAKSLLCILLILSAFSLLATLYQLSRWNTISESHKKGAFLDRIIMSFSMATNLGKIFPETNDEHMVILDMFKVTAAFGVILGHRLAGILFYMVFNVSFFESQVKKDLPLFMPTLIVDSFFIVAGFLTFQSCYEPVRKQGLKVIPLMIFNRWLRLMPSFMMLVAVTGLLFPYMSDGPAWKFFSHPIAESCQNTWWHYLLTINNLYSIDDPANYNVRDGWLCAPHTWYIACELQMFPVGVLIVYLFTKNQGLKFALAVLVSALAIPFFIIYFQRVDAVFKLDPRRYPLWLNVDYYFQVYIRSYMRAGPYIISILSAFLLFKIRANNYVLSVAWKWPIMLMAIAIGVGSQFYGFAFYDETLEYSAFQNALFGALHRSLWSIMICALIVIQVAWGLGETLDKLLTLKVYVSLSRLTYVTYLFHPIWQIATTLSSRTPLFLSEGRIIWMLAGDIVVVFAGSLLLYLIFEAPANNLREIFMTKITQLFIRKNERRPSRKLELDPLNDGKSRKNNDP
ncbi:unnamed protein product [Bemisia tabaci]|uniref:Nose resistant to fluoxetine protein 6 n=1 Tax=Bemisia tabaci TaxID=7038 RepID=A0A9P0A458_BEMTA|nr:unnamed protein product [Bemisia tabaci]